MNKIRNAELTNLLIWEWNNIEEENFIIKSEKFKEIVPSLVRDKNVSFYIDSNRLVVKINHLTFFFTEGLKYIVLENHIRIGSSRSVKIKRYYFKKTEKNYDLL